MSIRRLIPFGKMSFGIMAFKRMSIRENDLQEKDLWENVGEPLRSGEIAILAIVANYLSLIHI